MDENKKSTDIFKATILAEMQKRAKEDPLFAKSFAKEDKNIDDCITYVLNAVKATGQIGFTDDEVFGMAAHYYDEDKIDPGKPVSNVMVVGNAPVDLTEEEKAEAKKKALEELIAKEKERMSGKAKKPEVKKPEVKAEPQTSLF